MAQKNLDIIHAPKNFVHICVDGAMPAIELGFADRPLANADNIWSGERIPTPKKVWLNGRAL